MNWQDYIHSDPEVLLGKPVIIGTRLSVDFILNLFAQGWSAEKIIDNYPRLTSETLQAVFGFAAECMAQEAMYSLKKAS